nr:putative RNA-dependent RNA polymerase [Rhizoctonia solani mitovirus 115]
MILRNKGQAIVGIIARLLPVIAGRVTPTFVKVIKTTLAKVSGVAKTQGIPGVVKYLKAVGISLAQAFAGYKTVQTPRVSLTNSGFPRLFPVRLRQLMRRGHTAAMRLAMTLSSLYRDLEYDSQPKLGSIVNPFTGKDKMIVEAARFIPAFNRLFVVSKLPSGSTSLRDVIVGKFSYFTIFKSSPFIPGKGATFSLIKEVGVKLISTHPVTMIRSAVGLEPNIVEALTVLADMVKVPHTEGPMAQIRFIRDLFGDPGKLPFFFRVRGTPSGKLGLKQEAAGKVRVFAMVDPWTQMILRPFHKAIFCILAKWSMDGTFNQLRPLRRAWRFPALFSMDLSSATDRLPITLQRLLFKEVFSMTSEEADAWVEAMVGRFYRLPFGIFHNGQGAIKYAVGQPMGALSSWAMLALTHHFIVQVAAWQSGVVPETKLFKDYAVLGDDIVIFNAKVAKKYHVIMTALGVECNLAKSVMSPDGTVLEFAKRLFFKGINISPTPLREFAAALENPVALYNYKCKYNLSWPQIAKVAGFGYRVVGSITSKPLGKLNLKVRYLMFVGLMQDPQAVLDSLLNLRRGIASVEIRDQISAFIWNEYQRLLKSYQNTFQKLENVKFAPFKDIMKNSLPLKDQRLLYHNIFWAVYQPSKLSASLRLREGMDGLTKVFWKGTYANWELLDKIEAFLTLIEIDSKVATAGIDTFNTTKHEITSRNPVQVKMFKVHQAFAKFLKRSKDVLVTPSTSVEPLMSGFVPLHALKVLPRILPRAFKNVGFTKVFLTALRRRFLWTMGFTGVLSICSWFHGVPFVLGILLTIWTSVQALFVLDSSPGWSASNTLFAIAGNVILHSIELYLGGLILVGVYHHGLLVDLWNLGWQAYQAGNISLPSLLVELALALNRLLIETGSGVVPVISEYAQRLVVGNSVVVTYVLGYALSALLIFLIRLFIGI